MRIAVVQCPSILDDVRRAGDVNVDRLRWADQEDVDLTVFPEPFLLGHSYDPETIRSRASRGASAIAALRERVATIHSTLVVGAFDLVTGRSSTARPSLKPVRLSADMHRRIRTSRA